MTYAGIASDQLRAFVERIERLEEEKKALSDDIKEIYAEAKGNGFDTKVLRQVVRIRKQDQHERAEQEAILDLYMHALGMLPPDADPDPETPARHKAENKGRRKVSRAHGELAAESAASSFYEHMQNMGGGSITAGGRTVEIPARTEG